MWTDNETSLDLLGFHVHADLIRSVVTDAHLLPVTVGVFADWGGGKTSLMKMLQESFEPEHWAEGSEERRKCERIACLYFNGWLFEGYDDAKSAILSSVLVALGEHKRFGPNVRDKCVTLLKSVNWMRVAHLGLKHVAVPAIAAFATGGASIVPSLIASAGGLLPWSGEPSTGSTEKSSDSANADQPADRQTKGTEIDWEGLIKNDQSASSPLDVRTFREKFGQLLKDSDIDSLVVLIDDLDRCSPERIIENLEAIKLFLNVDNTAFVIGADPRIVRHAIAWKYKGREDANIEVEAPTIVTDYLEKLIQYPYRLPKLSPAEIETYMALLFCQSHLSEELFDATVNACNEKRSSNRYRVFGYSDVEKVAKDNGNPQLASDLVKALIFSAGAAPLITEGLKGNPRQVKRFLNAFVLRKKLAEVATLTNVDDAVLVKLMILEYSNEKRFRQLFEWQASQNGIPKEIAQYEYLLSGEEGEEEGVTIPDEWSVPQMQRWIKMEPSLSGIDLRDYFWVARDRLQSSLSGISMVSALVRRVFEGLTCDSAPERNAATASAKECDESEQEMLFELLQQHVKRFPGKKSTFDAFRSLVEASVPNAADQFASALSTAPSSEIPPAVGGDLLTLVKAKPASAGALAGVIESLKDSKTKVGKMISQLSEQSGE